ncbi:hypothetical protein [Streptomyces sp. NPDC090025]|uniref:hypothetical protein n=1 Tax=Streptomyces sp. NPDC090025 TaxID=3365922 RepID=UPI003837EEBF
MPVDPFAVLNAMLRAEAARNRTDAADTAQRPPKSTKAERETERAVAPTASTPAGEPEA